MATKITAENIDTLKTGDTVAKYPLTGDRVNQFDDSDPKQINFMQVGKVDHSTVDLLFEVPRGIEIAGMSVTMSPLHKNKKGMIEDNNWWIISN